MNTIINAIEDAIYYTKSHREDIKLGAAVAVVGGLVLGLFMALCMAD